MEECDGFIWLKSVSLKFPPTNSDYEHFFCFLLTNKLEIILSDNPAEIIMGLNSMFSD